MPSSAPLLARRVDLRTPERRARIDPPGDAPRGSAGPRVAADLRRLLGPPPLAEAFLRRVLTSPPAPARSPEPPPSAIARLRRALTSRPTLAARSPELRPPAITRLLPAALRGLLPGGVCALLLPTLFGSSAWLGLAAVGIGPLTELLGPRLRGGLGRSGSPERAPTERRSSLPVEFVELAQARMLLASLSRHLADRMLALVQLLDPLEAHSRPRREDLLACEALLHECVRAWHDLRRAAVRFCEAHDGLVARLHDAHTDLADAAIAGLHDAIEELLRFFDRVARNQQCRAQRLLKHAAVLEQHAARRGTRLATDLRAALAEFAEHVAHDQTPPGDDTIGHETLDG